MDPNSQASKYRTIAKGLGFAVFVCSMLALSPLGDSVDAANYYIPVLVTIILAMFFVACIVAGMAIETDNEIKSGNNAVNKLHGVYVLMGIALAFLLAQTVASSDSSFVEFINERAERTETTWYGSLLVMGAGAILFGFLDNYGMKLGTDALEGSVFWDAGKNAKRMKKDHTYSKTLNDSQVMDQLKKNFDNLNEKGAVKDLLREGLNLNDTKKLQELVDIYEKIQSAGGMMGNTFSDFVGALLGAGISGFFSHMTGISGSPDHVFFRNPVAQVMLEAIFIAIGCLIPVIMHFGLDSGTWIHLWRFPISPTAMALACGAIVIGLTFLQMATPATNEEMKRRADNNGENEFEHGGFEYRKRDGVWGKYDKETNELVQPESAEDKRSREHREDIVTSVVVFVVMVLVMVFLYNRFKVKVCQYSKKNESCPPWRPW